MVLLDDRLPCFINCCNKKALIQELIPDWFQTDSKVIPVNYIPDRGRAVLWHIDRSSGASTPSTTVEIIGYFQAIGDFRGRHRHCNTSLRKTALERGKLRNVVAIRYHYRLLHVAVRFCTTALTMSIGLVASFDGWRHCNARCCVSWVIQNQTICADHRNNCYYSSWYAGLGC